MKRLGSGAMDWADHLGCVSPELRGSLAEQADCMGCYLNSLSRAISCGLGVLTGLTTWDALLDLYTRIASCAGCGHIGLLWWAHSTVHD